MTDEEKIAQLLIVGFDGTTPGAELRKLVGEWHVGGVLFYAHNAESAPQVRRLTAAIGELAGDTLPFIAIDQEGGIVHRLAFVPVVPSNMAIAATGSADLARRAGYAVGSQLRDLGFTMNLAPVLDVLSDPENDAIGTRAFSDRPGLVAELGAAFVEGQYAAGIIAVGKHFPGQGGVSDDAHKTLPVLRASREQLLGRDIQPFAVATEHGLRAVMVSHLAVPSLDPSGRPATLSTAIMQDLLRRELRFDGIAISDAIQMKAVAGSTTAEELAIATITAGADVVMTVGTASERNEVYAALVKAYREGRLPRERVHEALRRILFVKRERPESQAITDETPAAVMAEIAKRAVTATGTLPLLPNDRDEDLLYVGPDGSLAKEMRRAKRVLLPTSMLRSEIETRSREAIALSTRARVVVVAATNESQFNVAQALRRAKPESSFVFINLGSPFRQLAGSPTLLTYGDDQASQEAAIAVLRGTRIATGIMPVSDAPKAKTRD